MADHREVYAQAKYYDIVFSRDVSHELSFAFEMYRDLNAGRLPTSLVDIACGPGYHALQAAQRGLRTYGLDLRREMVELARRKASAANVSVTWLAEDMRTFTLDQPVDIALTMFDSLDVLSSDEDVIAHIGTIHRNLTPGGVYLIDLSHPKDVNYGPYGSFEYTGQCDGISVRIRFSSPDSWDLLTGLVKTRACIDVARPDGRQEHFESEAQERLYLPRELNALFKEAGGFRNIGWYGAFRKNQPLDFSFQSTRQVGVYQRV
jgi:SAM-dependent methyltransferase